jgi:hypothetical protein
MDAARSVTATFDALALAVNDFTLSEGDARTTTADITVSLSAPTTETVTVAWATEDGSATAGSDYEAASGVVTFPAGSTSASVSVTVMGDTEIEPDESFYVNLSDPVNATIEDGQGRAQIDNDDFVHPGSFFTLSPCRVLDTRDTGDAYGGALVAGTDRVIPVIGRCGIPATARAISVNIAVTQPTAAGNLRLYPGGAPLATVSSINYSAGQTRANNAILPLNDSGELAVWCAQASGTAHFILDVNGYFE